jgi:hypothetical protein
MSYVSQSRRTASEEVARSLVTENVRGGKKKSGRAEILVTELGKG